MRPYLMTSGAVFGLVALSHVLRAFAEPEMLRTSPIEFAFIVATGVFAAALALWAWRLLRQAAAPPP